MRCRAVTILPTVAIAAAACAAVSANAASPPASWTISPSGIGPIKIGMSVAQAQRASGIRLGPLQKIDPSSSCAYVVPRNRKLHFSLILTNGRVGRVDTGSRDVPTDAGARVGDTERQVRARYPRGVVSRPHTYVKGGHELVVSPAGPSGRSHHVIFETDGHRVTYIRAGRDPEVVYVEGCA